MKRLYLLFAFIVCFCGLIAAQESSSLKILIKPTPLLSDEQGKQNIEAQGIVRLRIEFLANGEIGSITPLVSLPYGLTENAVEAAKKIKFEPEKQNGEAINKFKVVEYSFGRGGWANDSPKDEEAEAIIKRAVEKLGGQKYLQVKSQISTGNYTLIAGGQTQSPNSFVDALVFPDKERTEFKQNGSKTVQTNTGETGWLYDGATKAVKEQSKAEIEDFQRGLRTSLDALLREGWQGKAELSYAGKRQASIGKRNDVVRLTYTDGFAVEYEFSDDGTPVKAIYKRKNSNTGEEQKEEDRYAQFVELQGVFTPLVIDHYINDEHSSRINYLSIQFNKNISDAVFTKPNSAKDLKDLKF